VPAPELFRFVILEHDHPFLHWDLLLEFGDVLRSWRLRTPVVTQQWIHAESLPDHRCVYLDYEGPVSGNRGYVKRCYAGRFRLVTTADAKVPSRRDESLTTFELFDCPLASVARMRSGYDGEIEWWFE
jgi:hypothetical protein